MESHRLGAPVSFRLLDLAAEVGELAKEVLKSTRYGREPFQPTQDWAGELGDAFFSLICIANSTDVNLEEALQSALKKYKSRLARKGDVGSG